MSNISKPSGSPGRPTKPSHPKPQHVSSSPTNSQLSRSVSDVFITSRSSAPLRATRSDDSSERTSKSQERVNKVNKKERTPKPASSQQIKEREQTKSRKLKAQQEASRKKETEKEIDFKARTYHRLPGFSMPVFPARKIPNYLLDGFHERNRGKAGGFARMGYRTLTFEEHEYLPHSVVRTLLQEDTLHLEKAIAQGLKENTAEKRKGDLKVESYKVEMLVAGKNGKKYSITTGWVIQNVNGTSMPHLTTGWLNEKTE